MLKCANSQLSFLSWPGPTLNLSKFATFFLIKSLSVLKEIIGLIESGKQLPLEKSLGDCTLVGEKQINHSSTLDLYLETNGRKTAVALCPIM